MCFGAQLERKAINRVEEMQHLAIYWFTSFPSLLFSGSHQEALPHGPVARLIRRQPSG
jgi:hypothetical protein